MSQIPQPRDFIKINIDGMFKGSLHVFACEAVFRNCKGEFLCGFPCPLHVETAFATKLIAVILAIEHASIRGLTMLWIECDSPLTVHLCNKRLLPPWFLTHQWNNCIALMDSMTTRFPHVFGEGNGLADSLANLGATVDSFTWQDSAPPRCCFSFVEGCSYAAQLSVQLAL